MKEVNKQKKTKQVIVTKLYFTCFLAIMWPKSQVDTEHHLPTETRRCSKYPTFFSPALMWLHKTEQSIFTFMFLRLISFFSKTKCSWEKTETVIDYQSKVYLFLYFPGSLIFIPPDITYSRWIHFWFTFSLVTQHPKFCINNTKCILSCV